jgi:hypothetical protein
VISNFSGSLGGGSYQGKLLNSLVQGNSANYGGGALDGTLVNCTLSRNWAGGAGGGVYLNNGILRNCIISGNSIYPQRDPNAVQANWTIFSGSPNFSYCCTSPFPGGNNLGSDPQLVNGFHLPTTSPCRGAGSALYASGSDLDGEPWLSPPSIGCDEVWENAITGPLSVSLTSSWPAITQGRYVFLWAVVGGRLSRAAWDFGDGSNLTNATFLNNSHAWANPGDYVVTFTAFNADNPSGVSTNLVMHVLPLLPPAISPIGLTSNKFSLSFQGQPGVLYVVEQTTNLAAPVTWQTVNTLFSTGAVMQVTDTKATNAARFYRVRSQ